MGKRKGNSRDYTIVIRIDGRVRKKEGESGNWGNRVRGVRLLFRRGGGEEREGRSDKEWEMG